MNAGCVIAASCENATTAVAAASKARPDVCVVHLDLPGGGLTACRALVARSRPPRVVVLAPSGREGDVTAAARAGADGFVVDEVDPTQIPDVVAEVAAGRPSFSPTSTERLLAELRGPTASRKGASS
jgi:DNA-binding NarL/FixJ family response regulator